MLTPPPFQQSFRVVIDKDNHNIFGLQNLKDVQEKEEEQDLSDLVNQALSKYDELMG